MSIGENIKRFRKEKGLTQSTLAAAAKISRSYLGDVETNRYNPSLETLKAIATVLSVSVSDIVGDNPVQDEKHQAIQTIAAHLEDKEITPHKLKLLKRYIDDLFDEFDE